MKGRRHRCRCRRQTTVGTTVWWVPSGDDVRGINRKGDECAHQAEGFPWRCYPETLSGVCKYCCCVNMFWASIPESEDS